MDIQQYIQSGAIESYVLGLADPEDIAELLRLKETDPQVAAALKAAEKWLEDRAQALAVPPTEDIREKFLEMLQEPAPSPARSVPVFQMRPVRWYKYLAVASIVLFLVSSIYIYYLHRNYERAVANYALLSNPSVIKVTLHGVPGKENANATLYWDSRNKNVYLDGEHLPKAPSGRQYQLWALLEGKPIDAGVLEDESGVYQLKNIQNAQAFAVTLEKAGGSHTPTLSQMYVLGNVKF